MGRKAAQDGRQKDGSLSEAVEFQRARKNARAEREEWDVMSVAMIARKRQYALPYPVASDAKKEHRERPHVLDQRAGSFIGRLSIQGDISMAQYEAAILYADLCQQHSALIGGPKPMGAVNLNATGGVSNFPEDVDRSIRILERYKNMYRAITEKQMECRGFANLYGALSVCVLQDVPATNLVGDLKLGLNALSRFFKLDGLCTITTACTKTQAAAQKPKPLPLPKAKRP